MMLKNGMKIFSFVIVITIFFSLPAFAARDEIEYEIKRGLEIVGADERPMVFFFLPDMKLSFKEFDINRGLNLRETEIEKDIERMLEEAVK